MKRAVIIGVAGSRARGHIEAYANLPDAKVVAVSSRREAFAAAFADEFHIAGRYTDYRRMFADEKPDLVHVNTPPHARAEIIAAAGEAGVPAVLIEKPVAIQGEDWRALTELTNDLAPDPAAGRRTRVAVNHQLHYHPRRRWLVDRIRAGAIGDLRFLDASTGMDMATQGTHVLQMISDFAGSAKPTRVFAQASGSMKLQPDPRAHFAPDRLIAHLEFDTGLRALLTSGDIAPIVKPGSPVWAHKRLAAFGSAGSAAWTMWNWSLTIAGDRDVDENPAAMQQGSHDYRDEDLIAQAALTQSMFDWAEFDCADNARPSTSQPDAASQSAPQSGTTQTGAPQAGAHPLALSAALEEFRVMLAIYVSALERQPIDLATFDPPANLIQSMRTALAD